MGIKALYGLLDLYKGNQTIYNLWSSSLVEKGSSKKKKSKSKLCRIQRTACMAITGAMKTTSTSAMEALLDLTPLDVIIVGEVGCNTQHFEASDVESGLLEIRRHITADDILSMESDHINPVRHFIKYFRIIC